MKNEDSYESASQDVAYLSIPAFFCRSFGFENVMTVMESGTAEFAFTNKRIALTFADKKSPSHIYVITEMRMEKII